MQSKQILCFLRCNKRKYKGFTYFQIGTDCVFSGKTGKYYETNFTDADDVYGMSNKSCW